MPQTHLYQCSGESPCKTCAAVVSARVWKLDCIRTNIFKEFELYSTSENHLPYSSPVMANARKDLLDSLARYTANAATSQSEKLACSIGASHGTMHHHSLKFTALTVHPTFLELNVNVGTTSSAEDILKSIQTFGDETQSMIAINIQHYAETMGGTFRSERGSAFMRPTLQLAAAISTDKTVSKLCCLSN